MAGLGSKASHLMWLLRACIIKRAHLPGRTIHAQIITNGLHQDGFLSNKLIEFYSRCGCLSDSSRVYYEMPGRNAYSLNAIMCGYCKKGDIFSAYKLLGEMPEKNAISWNIVISALVRDESEEKALGLYYWMIREGFMPTQFTFASVLSACGSLMNLEHGRRCHCLAVKVGLSNNTFVENALVGMYTKCRDTAAAFKIFNEIAQPNEVSFTAMMGGLVFDGSSMEALRLFVKMARNGIQIDPIAISSVLGACTRSADDGEQRYSAKIKESSGDMFGQQVHVLVIKFGFELDTHVGNSLINMYAKSGDVDKAEIAFITLPEVDVVSCNVLIAAYMRSGDVEYAQRMFDRIINPTLSSWNTIVSGYCKLKIYDKAIKLFRNMQYLSVQADRATLAVVLSSCSETGLLNFGKQIHAASTRIMLHLDMFVTSGLVDMYSKCGHIGAARRVFDRMPERDVVCWNSMISGFALYSQSKEAFDFFRQMRTKGMCATEYSYSTIITACARLSSLCQGRQMHAQIVKDGWADDIFVGSTLIDMYAKCGNVEEARLLFDCMPEKNIVSWNEMILGYAQNGNGDMAVELFNSMLRAEEKPDSITFIAVLTACSHSGLVDLAVRFLNSMEKEHSLKPLSDHYTCVIDALGRAGHFNEIKTLVGKMPSKDDPIMWEVLLSACRVHANVDLGKVAAERLLHLDQRNPAPYLLLSNIYASIGRWDGVSVIRGLMIDRGIIKDCGYSWMDNKDSVHAFMVDGLTTVDDENKLSNHGVC